jgi:hypothetical protein
MRTTTLTICLFAALATACGGSAAQSEAKKTATAVSGADSAAAATNPQCKLFTPSELSAYAGERLSAGEVAAMGSGCHWAAVSGDGSVLIQVYPAEYHEPHRGAKGFRQVPDVGTKGFVESDLGGWNAGAITGPDAVVVAVSGPKASDAVAIALLKETIARRRK